jgi:HEAT repeat protein
MVGPLAALVVFAAASPLLAQNPPPPAPPAKPPAPAPSAPPAPQDPAKGDEKKPEPPQPIVDDSGNAAKIVMQYEKQLGDKDARVRADALAAFAIHRHESYVKVVAPLLKDKDDKVAAAAVAALGNQPFPPSIDALLNYACDDKKGAPTEELRRAAIEALGTTGLGKHGYDKLHDLFKTLDDDGKLAVLETMVKVKEKRSFSMLVDFVDEPNDKSANRPPTAVLKKIFDTWNKLKGTARRGLKDLTGESYPTAKQYIEWAKGPGAKLGFAYEHGK